MILSNALICLALNVYHESRGEPELGKKIVAQTAINRANLYNTSICKEVLKPNQYSWTKQLVYEKKLKPSGMPTDDKAWEDSKRIAQAAIDGNLSIPKRYQTATSFHSIRVHPNWSKQLRCVGRVGQHIVYEPRYEQAY